MDWHLISLPTASQTTCNGLSGARPCAMHFLHAAKNVAVGFSLVGSSYNHEFSLADPS